MKKIIIPDSEIQLSFARSSGPGGQNVNKVNSKVILHWNVKESSVLSEHLKKKFCIKFKNQINEDGLLQLSSQASRTQKHNIEDVKAKLEQMIEKIQHQPKARIKTKPSRSQVEKRLKSKKIDSLKKKLRKFIE